MKKIVFFNYFHNGDLHMSRGIVRQIIKKVLQLYPDTIFYYGHKNSPILLADIENLNFDNYALQTINDAHANLIQIGDATYINTWYAQQNFKYMNKYGISLDSLYSALNETCQKLWNFSLEDISNNVEDFYPIIDYSKFEIDNAKKWLAYNPGRKILVENGEALSGQATNFPMTPIIIDLAHKYPNIIFILTNKNHTTLPTNVIYSNDIIKKQNGADLNEVSFISSNCEMIIGRASGVFSFSLTQENLFSRNIKYLCFSNLVPEKADKFWLNNLLADRINYKSNIYVSNESNIYNVYNIIDSNLQ